MKTPRTFLAGILAMVGMVALGAAETAAVDRAATAGGLAGTDAKRDSHLDGRLTWVAPDGGAVVVQDDSGAVRLELDRPQPDLKAGQRAIIDGQLAAAGGVLRCGSRPVVDNDGAHGEHTRAGSIHLKAGRHPVRLEYFQRDRNQSLKVEFEGPGLPRQVVPAAALWHRDDRGEWAAGLRFSAYDGLWERLPVFMNLKPSAGGVAPDFSLGVPNRNRHYGVVFSGFLEVPADGDYRFHVTSNDGSRLFVAESRREVTPLDPAAEVAVLPVVAGQPWPAGNDYRWSEAEGTVGAPASDRGRWRFDLISDGGTLAVEVADPRKETPLPLRGSRVKVRGACYGATATDGTRRVAGLLVPGMDEVEARGLPEELWMQTPVTPVAGLSADRHPAGLLVRLRGQVLGHPTSDSIRIAHDQAEIEVLSLPAPLPALGGTIELLGKIGWRDAKPVLGPAVWRPVPAKDAPPLARPPLSSIQHVRATRPEDLPQRVRIRGVVTCDQHSRSATVQEAGAGISCWFLEDQSPPLQMGDLVELTGQLNRGSFAPYLVEATVERLGKAALPEPARPARETLLNGSLNAQWVEVDGVVEQVEGGLVTLGMAGGPIQARVLHGDRQALGDLRGAVVRVRGIVAPVYNQSHQIQDIYLRVSSPLHVSVLAAAAGDPFAAPLKRVPELLEFDPAGAFAFHRVRVAGQVLHASASGSFLSDAGHGARFVPRDPVDLAAGMQVEVSGVAQVDGLSPVLRDARVRVTGSAALPEPAEVGIGEMFGGAHDATRVRLTATLVGVAATRGEQLLEMQRDHWKFIARLPAGRLWDQPAAAGSELELTGVGAVHGGRRGGPGGESFELLLNSADDIRVRSHPPWWTARRMLMLAGVLAFVLSLALVWIVQLRRKVEERTARLAEEIHQRELAEQRRAIEEERSRIARDLHDDLGARVTKIAMLAEQSAGGPDGATPGVRMISDTSRELIQAMDEVVWTVNPRNDSLPRLAHYLLHYAESYFQGSGLRIRLKAPDDLPEIPVTAVVRHHLFLAVKEALRNVMKHSGASECRVELAVADRVFRVSVSDDGRGFEPGNATGGRNGLPNMKHRLAQLGGGCEWHSEPGKGTTLVLWIGLEKLGAPAGEG